MKQFFRQNGILLLIIALLLSILIWVGSAAMGKADPFSNAVNTVTAPIRTGISVALDWAERVYTYVFHYEELHTQLDELNIRVAELEEEVRAGQEASRENERLRQLLDLTEKRRDLTLESTRITAHSTDNWRSDFTISKGTASGIDVGNCVITATGALVGVVSEVGLNWATVSTILDPGTEMGGLISRTYSAGILEGDFALMDEGKLKLSYLPYNAQLVSGDEVVTSGKGDVYPPGLVVGQVEGVFNDVSGQSRYAVILPKADFDSLIHVFVIKAFDVVE